MILLLFIMVQVCDGLMTYAAVAIFGVVAEGNALLASWIQIAGPGPALLAAKVLAAGCGLLLHARGLHVTLAVLTAIYMLAAIAPWLVVFRSF